MAFRSQWKASPPFSARWSGIFLVILLLTFCVSMTRAQQDLPRCVQDQRVMLAEAGELLEGTLTPTDATQACQGSNARSLLILSQPMEPSLVFPYAGWQYRLAAADTGSQRIVFTAQALCNQVPVCEATVYYELSAPSQTTTTTKPPSSDSIPMCVSASASRERVYRPNETYMSRFPIDMENLHLSGSGCSLIATLINPELVTLGLVAVLPAYQYPLSYVYAVPELPSTTPVHFALGYTVSCDDRLVCADALQVTIENSLPACPNSGAVTIIKPGATIGGQASKESGLTCGSGSLAQIMSNVALESTVPMLTGLFTVQSDGDHYTFQAPNKEADVVVTASVQCSSSNTAAGDACETKMIFLVSSNGVGDASSPSEGSNATSKPSTPPPSPTPSSPYLFEYGVDVPMGSTVYGRLAPSNATLLKHPELSSCVAIRYTTPNPSEATNAEHEEEDRQSKQQEASFPSSSSVSGALIPNPPLLEDGESGSDHFRINLIGEFAYNSSASPDPVAKEPFIESVEVQVWCVTAYLGEARMFFTNYIPIVPPNTSTSGANNNQTNQEEEEENKKEEEEEDVMVPVCSNVYYYSTPIGIALSNSLRDMPGQDPCVMGRYFSLHTPPSEGTLELEENGDFLFTPPAGVETAVEARFNMYCLNQLACRGTAYIVVSDAFTTDPNDNGNSNNNNNNNNNSSELEMEKLPPTHLTCTGTCVNTESWITMPTHMMWDEMAIFNLFSPSSSASRSTFDDINVHWGGADSLVITVNTVIGNMGIRFPTFDRIEELSDLETNLTANSTALASSSFDLRCLAKQGDSGIGEDVWVWKSLNSQTGTGTVGPLYNSGISWYQKFGGKHDECNIFQTQGQSCQYAPLLTPSPSGLWSVDIRDCDATWTGVLPYSKLTQLQRATLNGTTSVFRFAQPRLLEGVILTEAVQPRSWLVPSDGVATDVQAYRIRVGLRQYVEVIKTALERPFSVDAEWFEFVASEADEQAGDLPPGSAAGDAGFGLNLLVYPSLVEGMPADLTGDHRVVGFKWVQQQWNAPNAEECPTCTGAKLRCYAGDDFATSSYEQKFPSGDCPPGVGRIHLFKGPATSESQQVQRCPAAAATHPSTWIYDRRGFSAVAGCATNYQNLTLRGVIPGSRYLSEQQKRGLNVDGMLLLQTLTSDGYRYNVRLHISLYVSYLSKTVLTLQEYERFYVNSTAWEEVFDNNGAYGAGAYGDDDEDNDNDGPSKPTSNFDPTVTTTGAPGVTAPPAAPTTTAPPVMVYSNSVYGELRVCRTSRYHPVLDPLGLSTPSDPLPLSGATPGSLCLDDVSTTYGPSDWGLFVINTANLRAYPGLQLRIGNIYVNYRRLNRPLMELDPSTDFARVYLRYMDPATHTVSVPPASILTTTHNVSDNSASNYINWWQYTQPYLAYRDVMNLTLSGAMSAEMAESLQVNRTKFAFLFIPGAMGWNGEAEVVVEAELLPATTTTTTSGNVADEYLHSRLEFRQVLHITPDLTELSRYGLPPSSGSVVTETNQQGNFFALVVVTAVAFLLILSVVLFLAADNRKPLPQWIPRGAILRKTVLSLVPNGLKKSGKAKKRKVKTAGSSTVVEVPIVKTNHKDMYEAMNSGQYI